MSKISVAWRLAAEQARLKLEIIARKKELENHEIRLHDLKLEWNEKWRKEHDEKIRKQSFFKKMFVKMFDIDQTYHTPSELYDGGNV